MFQMELTDDCCTVTLYFTIYIGWKETRNSRALRYFSVNNWLLLCCVCVCVCVALGGSLSYRLGYTIECASGPERRRVERGGLSPEVRGGYSQYLHQGNTVRKEYLKVRTAIDFFLWELEDKKHNNCVKTCLLRLWGTRFLCIHIQVSSSSQSFISDFKERHSKWRLWASSALIRPTTFFLCCRRHSRCEGVTGG